MLDSQISALFSIDAFRRLLANLPISVYQLNYITNALTAANIPFDTSFDSGNRKAAASTQLTIHVNPSMTLVFVVAMEPGASPFTPSP